MNKLILNLFLVVGLATLLLLCSPTFYKFYKLEKASLDTRSIYKGSPSLFKQVILFGDSRIKSWNPTPIFQDFTVLNRGVAGETTPQMIIRFEQDVIALQPDLLVIQAGINDLVLASMASSPLEKSERRQQCVDNLKNMVDLASKKGIKVILLSIVEPYKLGALRSLLWGSDLTELVQEVNRQLYVTHSNHMLNTNNFLPQSSDVKKDALHFTSKAYEILNYEIYIHTQKHN